MAFMVVSTVICLLAQHYDGMVKTYKYSMPFLFMLRRVYNLLLYFSLLFLFTGNQEVMYINSFKSHTVGHLSMDGR